MKENDQQKIQYDFLELRHRILDRYGTYKSFSETMGIHPSTLRRWLKNISYMPVHAIYKMFELLDIPEVDVQRFFFTSVLDTYMQMQEAHRVVY